MRVHVYDKFMHMCDLLPLYASSSTNSGLVSNIIIVGKLRIPRCINVTIPTIMRLAT